MTDIVLPAVSPTMEKATLSRWNVRPGSAIKRGDVIAELETDKASVEIAAEVDGVVSELVIAAGTADIPVGTVIARLGGPLVAVEEPQSQPQKKAATPESTVGKTTHERDGLASPLARRLARQLGIDVRGVQGSGQRGRITRADLERVDERLRTSRAPLGVPGPEPRYPPPHDVPHHVVALSAMRKTIARRLGESKRTVPHFYMTVDIGMDALLALREQCNLRASQRSESATKLSVNDFVIRAAALALQAVPAANVQYAGASLLRFDRADISVAVAVPEGLYTPLIRDAATKSVQAIAQEMQSLVTRAKAGTLHPNDYEGGTFSISNLGMYGIRQFEAVINPPQAAILAVGSIERRVVANADDSVRVARQLSVTLSCDHRVIDGAVGAAWLADFKHRMEDPLGILLA